MRTPVGDEDYHGLAGRKISNANFRAEWQSAMGCGRQISIEGRTARRFSFLVGIKRRPAGKRSIGGSIGRVIFRPGRLGSRLIVLNLRGVAGWAFRGRLCVGLRNYGPSIIEVLS